MEERKIKEDQKQKEEDQIIGWNTAQSSMSFQPDESVAPSSTKYSRLSKKREKD